MSDHQHIKAMLAREQLIGWLRSSDLPGSDTLADLLEGCTTAHPCRSAACPVCGLAFQAAAVSVVERFLREPARSVRGRMHASTIIPASGCVMPEALATEIISAVGVEIASAFETLDLPPAIIGLETSFNEDRTGSINPYWCSHGHGLGVDWLFEATIQALRGAFPRSPLVKRPLRVEILDDDERGRRYPFKPERSRRVTEWSKSDDQRNRHLVTRHRSLRPTQATRLALVEHQFGFHPRLVCHGIDEDAVRRYLEGLGWARDGP